MDVMKQMKQIKLFFTAIILAIRPVVQWKNKPCPVMLCKVYRGFDSPAGTKIY